MDRLALLVAAVLPALAILAWAVTKARAEWRNEALWNAFSLGALAAIAVGGLAALAHVAMPGAFPKDASTGMAFAAIQAVLGAAVPEEAAKFAILVLLIERHVDVRRKQDLLPMAVAISLGFAALENLFYLDDAKDWHSVAMLRALTAVPGHGVDGVLMGAMLTVARLVPANHTRRAAAALVLPVAAHAAYDFPLMAREAGVTGRWLIVAWLVVLAVSGVLALVLSSRAVTRAAVADADAGVAPRGNVVLPLGMAVMASGVAVCAVLVEIAELPWVALPMVLPVAILPLLFGGDLLLWWRRRTRRL